MVLPLILRISSGALLSAVALVAAAGQVSGSFDVNIGVTPKPSVCGTQQLKGRAGALARVDCLSNALPSLNVPGRSDVAGFSVNATRSAPASTMSAPLPASAPRLESASQAPATTNVGGLAATAAGPGSASSAADAGGSAGSAGAFTASGGPVAAANPADPVAADGAIAGDGAAGANGDEGGGRAAAAGPASGAGTKDDRVLRSAVVPVAPNRSQPSVIEVSF